MKSDFLSDFWKGFIVALGVSGAIFIVVELTRYMNKIKTLLVPSASGNYGDAFNVDVNLSKGKPITL